MTTFLAGVVVGIVIGAIAAALAIATVAIRLGLFGWDLYVRALGGKR